MKWNKAEKKKQNENEIKAKQPKRDDQTNGGGFLYAKWMELKAAMSSN